MATRRLTDRVLELDTLEVLEQIARAGSLSRAAQRLGITQQAVSARLAAAEHAVGVRLVVRSSQGSTMTEAGRMLLELAAPVLEAAHRLEAGLAALRQPAGTLTIAASQTIAELLIPEWLLELRRQSPEVTVRLIASNSAEVLELVNAGTAPLGFVEGPDIPSGLFWRPVCSDELVVVTAPEHPWASKSAVHAEDLATAQLLVREVGSGTRDTLEAWLATAGWSLSEPAATLDTTSIIRSHARAGVAPAVLSLRSAQPDLTAGSLVRIPLSGEPLLREFTAVWGREASPSVQKLLEIAGAA